MSSLDFVQRLAEKLLFVRKFVYILCLLLVSIIVYQLIFQPLSIPFQNSFANISLLVIAWLLLLNLMISIFGHSPAKITRTLSLFERVKVKLKQWMYILLSFVFIIMTFVIMFLSFRMLRV